MRFHMPPNLAIGRLKKTLKPIEKVQMIFAA